MNKLIKWQNQINGGDPEVNTVRTLYMVMCKVGGYENLMSLNVSTLNEIIKCMEWEAKEQSKGSKGRMR